MSPTKVAIVGLGTVGTGVARLLLQCGDRIARHAGGPLELARVVVKNPQKTRDIQLPAGLVTDDLARITADPQITVVAQLIGGLEPARSIMLELLAAGKDVVTANKALLAAHGPELFDRARELGRSIAFEASVAGGIPIVANISQCLSANQIESLNAILNGTSNYILTQMETHGSTYADAVLEAQRLGYAEADPTMDVDGSDTAQKLAILAHLAFGARVDWNDIPRKGIDTLDLADMRYAKELGYRIKLLAVAKLTSAGVELHVSPTLVRLGSPLAEVHGAYNAITVMGDAVGRAFFSGLGAGQMPTASAVVADLIDTAIGRTAITFRSLELWSTTRTRASASEYANVAGRYYLRFSVGDQPSVLAEIAGALGKQDISIASVIQHAPEDDRQAVVPLVIMTHNTTEGAVCQAIDAIDKLAFMRGRSVRMRVRDS
jgi:homoserine dehydrogenase